jgi:hypothetical protein
MGSPRFPRQLAGGLAAFDLVLGVTALFFPATYLALLHPAFAGGPTYLLARTGAIWLFFAGVEAWAAFLGGSLALVGALRLMDVPADPVYFASAGDLGTLGRIALLGSPLFNAAAGLYLVRHARTRPGAPQPS